MLMKLQPTSEAIDQSVTALSGPQSHVRLMTSPSWLQVIGAWYERSRQRLALANLDDRLLDDIGVTFPEAAREVAKPFWR